MTRSKWPLTLLITVAACGGSSATVGDGSNGGIFGGGAVWTGTVNASQCATTSADVPMLRCVAASGSAPLGTAVCGDLAVDNTLTLAGAFAVVGHSRTAAPLHVAGSFTSLGGIDANNTEDVTGDLLTNATVTVTSPMHVGGGASIMGALEATNSVTIGGALHVGQALDDNSTKNVTASSIATDAAPGRVGARGPRSRRGALAQSRSRRSVAADVGEALLRSSVSASSLMAICQSRHRVCELIHECGLQARLCQIAARLREDVVA